MKLIISPKDSSKKIEIKNVNFVYQEGTTLAIVYTDGTIRNYPLVHIWYYELQGVA